MQIARSARESQEVLNYYYFGRVVILPAHKYGIDVGLTAIEAWHYSLLVRALLVRWSSVVSRVLVVSQVGPTSQW